MSIKLKGSTAGSVALDAPANTSPSGSDIELTLPIDAGSANEFLKNGSTAGALEYSSMVEDSSGRVGIGTTAPSDANSNADDLVIKATGSGAGITIFSDTDNFGNIFFGDGSSAAHRGRLRYDHSNDALTFSTSATERMRITSDGNIRFGQTTSDQPGNGNTTTGIALNPDGRFFSSMGGTFSSFNRNSDGTVIRFARSNSDVGSIGVSSSSTSFNTSSDYRLKENVVALDGAIDRVKQLLPKRFNFIVDADTTVDGFLAHEAQTVVPEAVTGTHNEVDDDNNPVYQGIDQSKLVPLLTAALQEAIGKIETLETKVAALEAA
jgi:hypothetical protein